MTSSSRPEDRNPWLQIPADEYDVHLAHPDVRQRQFLDHVFGHAISKHQPRSIALLGCATGGGLQLVDPAIVQQVTAIDLNPEYVEITRSRFAACLPLKLLNADLEDCELDPGTYDLIHSALVFEYVNPSSVLARIARWLAPTGVLVVVLQLESDNVKAVTDTGCESLKLLEPFMKLHTPDEICELAALANLDECRRSIETLPGGKQFYIGEFQLVGATGEST